MGERQTDDAAPDGARAPRVGVVLCARDAEATLADALESLRVQTFRDFACQVIDDGSSDRTAEIAEGVAALDPRFRVVRQPGRGLTPSLRHGVAACASELLARMDADDVARPDRFARQVAYLDAHPDCVAVGGEVLVVDPERRPIHRGGVPLEHEAIEARLLRGEGSALPHPALMARREVVLSVGSYDDTYATAQDLDLYLRLGEVGRLANLPEIVLEYRKHPQAVSATRTREQIDTANRILRAAHARRGLGAAPVLALPAPRRDVETWRRWARAALGAGFRRTSVHYAWATLRAEPSASHLYLLGRALLGWRVGRTA